MSLMNYTVRPKPKNEVDTTPWNLKDLDKKWEEYNRAFYDQYKLMEKKIGCHLPVEGHRILLKAVTLPEKTKSGLYMSEQSKELAAVGYDIGLVVGVGPEAYRDKERFPYGPRCKVGDWVDFSPFEKQKKKFNNYICFVINDDRVNFSIPDITRTVFELRSYAMQEIEEML
jgi:co-chaperonin GroES (HSP10)